MLSPHSRIQHYRKVGTERLVRKEGFEPPRPFGHKILSLARLPVPPLPQWCFYSTSLPRAAPPRFSAHVFVFSSPLACCHPESAAAGDLPFASKRSFAGLFGQNAQFAQDQHIHVYRQLVPHQAGISIVRSDPVRYPSMRRITSFSCSSRPAFFTVIKSFLESKCTVICFDLAAHQILRSPIAVSLQISVSSCVTAFHSAHFSKIASLTLFQTRGARATANAILCFSSYICSSSVSFAARYSCAACFVLSSLIGPIPR